MNKLRFILSLSLSLLMAVQVPAVAQTVVAISIPIIIIVKKTTHPDYYSTQLSLKMTSPVVCDLDCDWVLDVVCAGYNPGTQKSNVYVWNRNGGLESGWPVEVDGRIENVPAVGDLDGDGDLEIVASVSKNPPAVGGWVYVWHHDGALYSGYPLELDYKPGAPLVGDVTGGFEEEPIVHESDMGLAICDIDLDGKKEVVIASPFGVDVLNGDDIELEGWPVPLLTIGNPVAGDVDGDGRPEVFLPVKTPDANYIYGWHNDGSAISGWPVNIAGVVNAPGNFLSLGDIDGDGEAEILSGSTNGWLVAWRFNGTVLFSNRPAISADRAPTNAIYQPLVGDIDNDGDMEILATSKYGNIYCYDHNGNPVAGWPHTINYELSPGAVLVDIESDSLGDELNPANDLELLFSAYDGNVHSIDLPGDFHPDSIQWGIYGFNSRDSGNYLRDWDTSGWSVFDNEPRGAEIQNVYDWTRGARVIELKGAGTNNSYVFKKPDGRPFNSRDTTLQWSMRFDMPFYIYVSVDTIKGKRYLYYSPVDGNQPREGSYIHHGLGGGARNGRWHTFSRQLVQDLKDAEPDNEIIDVNAVYVQGSGRIDDVMLLPGLPCANMFITVSSGEDTVGNLLDDDISTGWVSETEERPWIRYTWDIPVEISSLLLSNVSGAGSVDVYIYFEDGTVRHVNIGELLAGASSVVFVFDPPLEGVRSILIEFSNRDGNVSVGEIDINEAVIPEEEYSPDDYIRMQDRYFFDPVRDTYWIPHGIACQVWNRDTGQWQSPTEIRNDLSMMAGIGANAVRIDFSWKNIETADGIYDWSMYDILLEEAQARGVKVFPVIDYRLVPDWCIRGHPDWCSRYPRDSEHPGGAWQADILSYENIQAREQFRHFLEVLVYRYSADGDRKDLGDTIAGWILGSEYGYIDSENLKYYGYDTSSRDVFGEYLRGKYSSDISLVNAKWAQDNIVTAGYLPNYPYSDFDQVDMPIPFGYSGDTSGVYIARDKASWYDLIEWRKLSIAGFVAYITEAVRNTDPNHLISYESVGLQKGEEDWEYTTGGSGLIEALCREQGTPLDFWCISNYPWALENSELVTGQYGIEKARYDTGLPVMVTKTGFSSTETLYPGIDDERQAKLIRNAIWESLETGAIGVCVFNWNDRDLESIALRERGFGIVTQAKEPKPAYQAVRDAFNKMDEIEIAQFLVRGEDPRRNIALLLDDSIDAVISDYYPEMDALFGVLERLGYEPTFIDDKEIITDIYLNYDAIILPNNPRMFEDVFNQLDDIKAGGVKIHANMCMPGRMDEYGEMRNEEDWSLAMENIFGRGIIGSVDPALFLNNDTAVSLLYSFRDGSPFDWTWSSRYDFIKSIYTDSAGFGIQPELNVSNKNILVDYRTCSDGSVLLSFRNYKNDTEETTTVTLDLITGKTILCLLDNDFEVIEESSDGTIQRTVEPDGHDLLLAWVGDPGDDPPEDPLDDDPEDPDDPPDDDPEDPDDPPDDDPEDPDDPPDDDPEDPDDPPDDDPEDPDDPPDDDPEDPDDPGDPGDPGRSTGDTGGTGTGGTGQTDSTGQTGSTGITGTGRTVSVETLGGQYSDNDSSDYIGGPASVIILGEGEDKNVSGTARTSQSEDSGNRTSGRLPHIRTHVGSAYRGGSAESGGRENMPVPLPITEPLEPVNNRQFIEQLPPVEQFRQNIENTMDRNARIVTAKPELVPPARLSEIVKLPKVQTKKSVPAFNFSSVISNLVSKFKDLWQNLVKKTQFVCKSISHRVA